MQKKLTLYKLKNESGSAKYTVSETELPDAKPLAEYNDISELYPNFYNANDTYDVSSFSSNSAVNTFYATTPTRTVSDAARTSIGLANSMHQSGTGNSQYGTTWIYSDEEKRSKKIRCTDEIPEGWKKGRKMKFDED